jgi:hypothetical protein
LFVKYRKPGFVDALPPAAAIVEQTAIFNCRYLIRNSKLIKYGIPAFSVNYDMWGCLAGEAGRSFTILSGTAKIPFIMGRTNAKRPIEDREVHKSGGNRRK